MLEIIGLVLLIGLARAVSRVPALSSDDYSYTGR
jgi:hypothetical protein